MAVTSPLCRYARGNGACRYMKTLDFLPDTDQHNCDCNSNNRKVDFCIAKSLNTSSIAHKMEGEHDRGRGAVRTPFSRIKPHLRIPGTPSFNYHANLSHWPEGIIHTESAHTPVKRKPRREGLLDCRVNKGGSARDLGRLL